MITGKTRQGLRYAISRRSGAVAYLAMSVASGTRDEKGFHEGIAHFAEHTIFKGTSKRSASSINACLDRLGGELNAFTTKEETVFHATVLKEDYRKAADLLFDLVSSASFPSKEVETEKGVVLDEISQYKDSPSEDIYDRFEEMLFEGHDLGGRILGSNSSVKKIDSQELMRYRRERFMPQRMAFTVVADIDEKKVESFILSHADKYFGEADCALAPRELRAPLPVHFCKQIDKRNHEANAVLGYYAPSINDGRDRIVCVLLCNILGGPASNSILGSQLREKNGWVYGVECSYTQYSDSGIVTIALGCDKGNLEKCFAAIDSALEKMQTQTMSASGLRSAKKQLMGQLMISSDSGETQCLSMGKSLLAFGRIPTDKENKELIESITSEELKAMAVRVFDREKLCRLVYL